MKTLQGFTLVELLAAIAIVAILAVALLSAGTKISESAKAASCAANLRMIGQAVQLYAADNGSYLPPGYVRLDDGTVSVWFAGIAPYLAETSSKKPKDNARDVRYCPETSVRGEGIFLRDRATWRTDYACNNYFFAATLSGNEVKRMKNTAFTAKTIVAYDGLQSGTEIKPNAHPRHSGRINVLFFDNHVEPMEEMPTDPIYWKSQSDLE